MSVSVVEFSFKVGNAPISSDSVSFRPPRWPPPRDWVVSEDAQGNALSRWGDDFWDFSAWAGVSFKLDIAGGKHKNSVAALSPQNQDILRILATWLIWGHHGPRAWRTLKGVFGILRRVFVFCDREGVLVSEIGRFPKIIDQIPMLIPREKERAVILAVFDRLLRAKDIVGFAIFDEDDLIRLSKGFKDFSEVEDVEQTAYIPPRIWTYQILRLRECLDDFLNHSNQVEECYHFCVDAYAKNFGSLEKALDKKGVGMPLPFILRPEKGAGKRTGHVFYGPFEKTAQRFGILELLRRWALPCSGKIELKQFSLYLNLVQTASIIYIANFTLQRKEEATSLRADCLLWDEDPVLGRLPVICGETTKTDPDSDARWPTSPSVEIAVKAASVVARMRIRCAAANNAVNCSDYDKQNPMLFHAAFEPWATKLWSKNYSIGISITPYNSCLKRFPCLFDTEVLKITDEDLTKARMFTPNLDKKGAFKVGKIWPLALHQLRRTGGVNMFASGIMSDSSIQVIMKHLTLLQTRYYGRNHSRLRFSEEFEGICVAARYEVLARQIQNLVEDRYVSPLGQQRKQEVIVNLIGAKDFKKLVKAGKTGEVSFRETRLGGCTKAGHCDYGGIESVTRCAGGDGDKPCRDSIFDVKKRPSIERQLKEVEQKIRAADIGSPRQKALQAEAQGLRNYLNATTS